ncbi:MAG: response regulator transcription factor [Scytolyngbya sp. HA4215-MV1]|jgi:two-component system NarL family response regulator|nr:response regulator transcription factor [Scytolyngbya sp. HA4215-MV1]
MPSPPLQVLIVEDDELFRLGLRVRLQQEPGLEVVAEAEDGETAIELVRHHALNLVILDIGLPGIGGIEACRQIKQYCPQLPVLVLTSQTPKSLINRMIEVGAQGYCLKGLSSELLMLAIRSVAAGASWWDSTATTEIQTAFKDHPSQEQRPQTTATPSPALTRREQEILALIATGKTNQQIAEMLYITPGTVRVHVHAILQKLEVRDRAQAAILAIQNQLIAKDLL